MISRGIPSKPGTDARRRRVWLLEGDTFNQGVAAGEENAASAIQIENPCVSKLEEHGPLHVPGIAMNGAEILHDLWEPRQLKTLAGGVAGSWSR